MVLYVPGTEETDLKKIIMSLQANGAVNTPGQRKGIDTNTAAIAGNIGELIESSIPFASAVSLANGVAADVTSIPLTAGNWLAWGNVPFIAGATTTSTRHAAWISATSATFPTAPNGGALAEMQVAHSAGFSPTFAVGMMRISLAAPATYYLGAYSVFAVSTMKAYGYIGALRVS